MSGLSGVSAASGTMRTFSCPKRCLAQESSSAVVVASVLLQPKPIRQFSEHLQVGQSREHCSGLLGDTRSPAQPSEVIAARWRGWQQSEAEKLALFPPRRAWRVPGSLHLAGSASRKALCLGSQPEREQRVHDFAAARVRRRLGGLSQIGQCTDRLLPVLGWAAFTPITQAAQRAVHFTESAAQRLSIEAVLRCAPSAWRPCTLPACVSAVVPLRMRHTCCPLESRRGHHGCVNRLCWNEAGTLLASGSDDRKVRWGSLPAPLLQLHRSLQHQNTALPHTAHMGRRCPALPRLATYARPRCTPPTLKPLPSDPRGRSCCGATPIPSGSRWR